MMNKLKDHFLKLGPRNCVVGTILLLIVLDVLNMIYLRLYWVNKDMSLNFVHLALRYNGLVAEDFNRETMNEMTGFLDNTFYFLIFLISINNLFFYFFYLRKKLWAQGYVLFYTLTGALFAFTFIIDPVDLGIGWKLYNIATIFIYLYLFMGVKVLKYETTDAIPVGGN